MSLPFTKEQMGPMIMFLDLLKRNPSSLHSPSLEFLKSFVEHFGGKIPEAPPSEEPKQKEETSDAKDNKAEPEPESEESDLELDTTGVIEADNDPPQEMGNPSFTPSEEDVAESQGKRAEAVAAFVEKDYERALALYTEAIKLNPQAALLYAKRGQLYLLIGKPNACIRDCDRALELNPDSAAGHKFRGRAKQLLGRFDEAAIDLRLACQFDFDEQTDEWLREVTPNALKIEEHKRKKERKLSEKAARARASAAKGAGTKATALQDPDVEQAFLDIISNPANLYKYKDNPKIMKLLETASFKAATSAGMSDFSGMMGGMPGFFPGAAPPPNPPQPNTGAPKPSAPDDDVGLD